jgi:excisionase family DNA binding protein
MEMVERVHRGLPLNVADTGRLIGVDEAAERLGISARTVRRLVKQRKIRHLRFGRLIRLNVWDVDSFLTNATVEPMEEPDR